MANVLLGVTGSVAAIKTPALADGLRRAGHAVKVVATEAALYFFDPLDLTPGRAERALNCPTLPQPGKLGTRAGLGVKIRLGPGLVGADWRPAP